LNNKILQIENPSSTSTGTDTETKIKSLSPTGPRIPIPIPQDTILRMKKDDTITHIPIVPVSIGPVIASMPVLSENTTSSRRSGSEDEPDDEREQEDDLWVPDEIKMVTSIENINSGTTTVSMIGGLQMLQQDDIDDMDRENSSDSIVHFPKLSSSR